MKKIHLVLFIFILAIFISAFSTAPTEEAVDREIIKSPPMHTVRGTIRMIGNEPFTKIIIEAANGEVFEVKGGAQYEMAKYQGSRISAFGRVTRQGTSEVDFVIVARDFHIINGEQ